MHCALNSFDEARPRAGHAATKRANPNVKMCASEMIMASASFQCSSPACGSLELSTPSVAEPSGSMSVPLSLRY